MVVENGDDDVDQLINEFDEKVLNLGIDTVSIVGGLRCSICFGAALECHQKSS